MSELTQEQHAADQVSAAELRAAMALIDRRFPIWCMASQAPTQPKDITERSYKIPTIAPFSILTGSPAAMIPAITAAL
jgi:hypothetical protein